MDKRVKTTDDVVDASHIVVREGCVPCRIVLRKLEGEYVTHMEILISRDNGNVDGGFEHRGFDCGHYFRFRSDGGFGDEAYKQAQGDFEKRAREL
jgi:hypothetical protein